MGSLAFGTLGNGDSETPSSFRLKEVTQIWRNWVGACEKVGRTRQLLFTICIFSLVGGVGFLDYASGRDLSLAIVYLVPVLIGTWIRGLSYGLSVAAAGTLVSFVADLLSARAIGQSVPLWLYWNTVVRLIVLGVVVYLLGMARRLTQELESSVARVTNRLLTESDERRRIESELLKIADEERRRLAQDLHDDLASYLTGVAFRAKALEGESAQSSEPLRERAAELVRLVNGGVARIRAIAGTLDPVYASSNGLPAALERLAAQTEELFETCCLFENDAPGFEIDVQRGIHLYRITQEAVQNAIKHGKATEIRISLREQGEHIALSILDNGGGFHPTRNASAGLGLRTMRYRADLMKGTLRITALPEQGCRIVCTVPTVITSPPHEFPPRLN